MTNEETTEAGGTTEYEYYETYDTTDTTDYPTGSTATSDYPATRPSGAGGGGSIKNYRKNEQTVEHETLKTNIQYLEKS